MNADATAPLPGLSIADSCREKIREMLAPYLSPNVRVDYGAALWDALSQDERAFVCRLARMDRNAAAVEWRDMPDDFRDAIVRAWRSLHEFVGRVELLIDRRSRR